MRTFKKKKRIFNLKRKAKKSLKEIKNSSQSPSYLRRSLMKSLLLRRQLGTAQFHKEALKRILKRISRKKAEKRSVPTKKSNSRK